MFPDGIIFARSVDEEAVLGEDTPDFLTRPAPDDLLWGVGQSAPSVAGCCLMMLDAGSVGWAGPGLPAPSDNEDDLKQNRS